MSGKKAVIVKKGNPKLTPHTVKIINSIENKEIRNLLLEGLHPSEVVEGWYYAMALALFNWQEKRNGRS